MLQQLPGRHGFTKWDPDNISQAETGMYYFFHDKGVEEQTALLDCGNGILVRVFAWRQARNDNRKVLSFDLSPMVKDAAGRLKPLDGILREWGLDRDTAAARIKSYAGREKVPDADVALSGSDLITMSVNSFGWAADELYKRVDSIEPAHSAFHRMMTPEGSFSHGFTKWDPARLSQAETDRYYYIHNNGVEEQTALVDCGNGILVRVFAWRQVRTHNNKVLSFDISPMVKDETGKLNPLDGVLREWGLDVETAEGRINNYALRENVPNANVALFGRDLTTMPLNSFGRALDELYNRVDSIEPAHSGFHRMMTPGFNFSTSAPYPSPG